MCFFNKFFLFQITKYMKVLVIFAVFCLYEKGWMNPAGRLASFKSNFISWFLPLLICSLYPDWRGSMPYIPSTRSGRVARHLGQDIPVYNTQADR